MPAEKFTPKSRVDRLLEGAKKKPSGPLHISEFRKLYAGRQKSLTIVLRKEELDGNLPDELEIPEGGLRVAFKRGSSVNVHSTSWWVVTYGEDTKHGEIRVLAKCSKTGIIENRDGSLTQYVEGEMALFPASFLGAHAALSRQQKQL